MPTFTLNFSRPGNQIVGQYYNFVRLGRAGYTRIMETLRDIAAPPLRRHRRDDGFEVISDGSAIPVLAFNMVDGSPFTVFHVSDQLRTSGWQVPAYTMPDDATDVAVLRIVVREGFSMDLADSLLDELRKAVAHLHDVPAEPAARRPRGSATPERHRAHAVADGSSAASPGRSAGGSRGCSWSARSCSRSGRSRPTRRPWTPPSVGVTFVVGSMFFTSAAPRQLRPDGPRAGEPPAACGRAACSSSAPCSSTSTRSDALHRQPRHRARRTGWSGRRTSSDRSPSWSPATSRGWSCAGGCWRVRRDDADWWVGGAQLRRVDLLHGVGHRVVHAHDHRRRAQHHHRQHRHLPRRGLLPRRRLPAAPPRATTPLRWPRS